ncbi:MAG: ribosomal protein S18-alanine N-acetyltransferase [Clostridiales bacterium]|jgi:ribosomal-protein-alanine N-acetyltransferase|nr:ribosomal protein S18-alanine N-acetyltransferase [Clostridiales bacterium]
MNITYRLMCKDDVEGIFNVSNLSFNTPWSKDSISNEVNNPLAKYIVAIDNSNNELVGFIGAWIIAGEADIMNVAVHPSYRKVGIASKLLSSLIDLCNNLNCSNINLEVRASNLPAQNLYKKFSFIENGLRKGYYEDTGEDAILMQCTVQGNK